MINGRKILAIIPARGGSKRLPRKNMLLLNDQPLISHSIEAALMSKYIDKVVVSSDSSEILEFASTYALVSSHKRPDSLAQDTSSTIDCVFDVVSVYDQYDCIVLLQPTSPLRTSGDIDNAFELFIDRNAESVISVCECEHSPLWTNTLDESLSMGTFIADEIKDKRSQDLDTYYRINGAIYISSIKPLMKQKTFFLREGSFAFPMPKDHSVDIDDKLDFLMAKLILESD